MRKAVRFGVFTLGSFAAYSLATGFPSRVGLTRSQTLVSMPGDLVIPTAQLQADRGVVVGSHSEDVWALLGGLVARYESIWKTSLEPVYEEAPNLLVLKSSDPDRAIQVLLQITINEVADGETDIRIRERYRVEDRADKMVVWASMKFTALSAIVWFGRLRRDFASSSRVAK